MATYDIDKLQIEITASSSKAASNIERLTKALADLKTAVSGATQTLDEVKQEIDKTGDSAEETSEKMDKASDKQEKMGNSSAKAAIKVGVLYATLKKVGSTMAKWINESNEYIENLNLFEVAMGSAAAEAKEYAETVQAALGIDPSEWMQNQAMFKQVTSGFGVAEKTANAMSKQLTQLGYDISSLYNISIEEAMQKLQSGIAGEIEPLRRLGFAIDNATIQQVAYEHGITTLVKNMNQAQKSQLRYIAIMEQSTNAQGDLARTAQTPANAIRILKQQVTQLARAMGNILLPALQAVLPIAQAVVEVLTEAAQKLANFFGFELPTIDYSGLDGVTSGANDAEDALNGATAAAKKLNNTLGIDELNILKEPSSSSSGSSYETDLGIDMSQWDYDFLGEVQAKADDLKETAKDILKFVEAIGAGLFAWKVTANVIDIFSTIKQLLGSKTGKVSIGLALVVTGATMSYDAGYSLGYDGGSPLDIVKGVLGPVATALGGAAIGSAIMPGIGTVAGGITGLVVGIVMEVVGHMKGVKQGILDQFYETELGQEILELESQAQEIQIKFYATGKISTEDLANLQLARNLLDDIFTAYEQDNHTSAELQSIIDNIELFNSLGLGEITYEFDGVHISIQQTREELDTLIGSMEEEMRLEALKEGYIEKYKALAEQQSVVLQLEEDLNEVKSNKAAYQTRLDQIRAELDAYAEEYKALDILKVSEEGLTQAQCERYNDIVEAQKELQDEHEKVEKALKDSSTAVDNITEKYNIQVDALVELQGAFDSYVKAYKQQSGVILSEVAKQKDEFDSLTDSVVGLAKSLTNINSVTNGSISIKANTKVFASGGFPEHGELFIANEAGPELVGRIGNRTAVANADQIVTAVASGVRNANDPVVTAVYAMAAQVVRAIAEKDTNTYLDSKKITTAQSQRSRAYGV